MPLPNEHSCRLKDPGQFVRFFRKHVKDSNDIGDYKATGKPYDLLIGYRKDGSSDVQANRYKKDTWTAEEARKHCKAHKGILFEPASGGSSSIDLDEDNCCGAEDFTEELYPNEVGEMEVIKHSYILDVFMQTPWAIVPYKLAILGEIVARHVAGETLDPEEVQMRIHGARRPADSQVGNIAVLPLFGIIFPRANLMTQVSGATSAEIFGTKFDELIQDPEVGAIVLDVNSPGGQISGIEELSRQIYDSRGKKPIVAVANHEMDSAAYWIGTAAGEVVVTPSGELGSIGVWAAHDDISGSLAQAGIKRTLISAGKYKTEGNPWEPLTEEARAAIQISVNESYDAFVKAVARNRGVKIDQVRNEFGEGRSVGARQAIESGMADRVEMLSETITRLRRSIITLSKEQLQKAEDLRAKINSILRKGN